MSSKSKYKREQKARYEVKQCQFGLRDGDVEVIANMHKYATITKDFCEPTKKVTCPFCLGMEQLRKFLESTKKGYDHRNGKCPICENGVMLKTLMEMQKTDAKKFAKWVYEYPGFFKKCKFSEFKKHLNIMGWGKEFWEEYKNLKGSDEEKDKLTGEATENENESWNTYEQSFGVISNGKSA